MSSTLRWIEVSFVDVLGTMNSVQLPAGRWPQALTDGVLFDGSALEGRARVFESDMLLRPVESTLITFPDGLGRALGEVLTVDAEPWPGDPRAVLASVVEQCGELGGRWQAASELEFYLLDLEREPVDRGFYFDAIDGSGARVVRAAAELIDARGIEVQSCHHEAGPGQYELDLAPLGAVALADALTIAKQVVRESARANGLRATFMARPLEAQAGSGLHLHQTSGEALTDERDGLQPTGRAYLAGQLAHAPGLCALTSPNVNSYKRLHGTGEAPGAVMWSHRHRSALLRVSASGIEHRGADASANPYLLIAGLLLAGVDGVESKLQLGPPHDESVGGFDPTLEVVQYRPLPRTLDDALDALLADDVLVDGLGDELLRHLVDGRRSEAAAYRQHVTGWELERYLDDA
jgi:glutamine synthetase